MLHVKKSVRTGCTYLGKGIVEHPEMGVIMERREVTFDEWNLICGEWAGHEITKAMDFADNNIGQNNSYDLSTTTLGVRRIHTFYDEEKTRATWGSIRSRHRSGVYGWVVGDYNFYIFSLVVVSAVNCAFIDNYGHTGNLGGYAYGVRPAQAQNFHMLL